MPRGIRGPRPEHDTRMWICTNYECSRYNVRTVGTDTDHITVKGECSQCGKKMWFDRRTRDVEHY